MFLNLIILLKVYLTDSATLDLLDCGVDNEPTVVEGLLDVTEYPWCGVLYYEFYGQDGETRAVTTVALIHREFVIAPAADIGPMPKRDFRKRTRVLLGEDWKFPGRRVRNYIIHPEYGDTYNTICLVQLKDDVRNHADVIEKEVIRVVHIPGKMCKDFYVSANLYSKMMRPPHVTCAVQMSTKDVCVWSAGGALVARDAWGRWQLLGLGVRGPGCGAPSRYLDMMSYYPWIIDSLSKFRELTISKLNKQKFVLRYSGQETSGGFSPDLIGKRVFQRFGACDKEEKENLVFRDVLSLRTDSNVNQEVKYNLTIDQHVEFTCLTLELINASATSEMRIVHDFTRFQGGPACYTHKGSTFDISISIIFGDTCLFELAAWGHAIKMDLLGIQEHKWREGEYYPDFTMTKVEYRGPSDMTGYGFEPLDRSEWVPEYDLWTTTLRPEYVEIIPYEYLPIEVRLITTKKRKVSPKYKKHRQQQKRAIRAIY